MLSGKVKEIIDFLIANLVFSKFPNARVAALSPLILMPKFSFSFLSTFNSWKQGILRVQVWQ